MTLYVDSSLLCTVENLESLLYIVQTKKKIYNHALNFLKAHPTPFRKLEKKGSSHTAYGRDQGAGLALGVDSDISLETTMLRCLLHKPELWEWRANLWSNITMHAQ